jgi:hypothetical protein
MTTRPRSSNWRLVFGAFCALGVLTSAPSVSAQTSTAEEVALRQRYGVTGWFAGPTHLGVAIDRIAVRGLLLRVRSDRVASDGGISLSFGTNATTLRIRVAVGSSIAEGRDAMVSFLRGAETDLATLADRQGADVALGDSARGDEAVAALYGNIAISIQRTREAGPETPSASQVLATLRSFFAPVGLPARPALTLHNHDGHVELQGATFTHVEATVRGGHLLGKPSPSGLYVVIDRPGAVDVRVVATDALGRSAMAEGAVSATPRTTP